MHKLVYPTSSTDDTLEGEHDMPPITGREHPDKDSYDIQHQTSSILKQNKTITITKRKETSDESKMRKHDYSTYGANSQEEDLYQSNRRQSNMPRHVRLIDEEERAVNSKFTLWVIGISASLFGIVILSIVLAAFLIYVRVSPNRGTYEKDCLYLP